MANRIRIGNQTAFSAARLMEPLEFAVKHGFGAFELGGFILMTEGAVNAVLRFVIDQFFLPVKLFLHEDLTGLRPSGKQPCLEETLGGSKKKKGC